MYNKELIIKLKVMQKLDILREELYHLQMKLISAKNKDEIRHYQLQLMETKYMIEAIEERLNNNIISEGNKLR